MEERKTADGLDPVSLGKINFENELRGNKKRNAGVLLLGCFLGGMVLTVLLVWFLMPRLMIVTKASTLGFDETVAAIEKAIPEHGWASPGTMDMNKALAKNGIELRPRVQLIKLCHAEHAKNVLMTDRYIAAIMPCTLAIWEDDDGVVYISKMNMGLMAKMFGGNIGKVMGGDVAKDEASILAGMIR
jgi:uncharacterized protein (DUF302 family)